MRNYLSNEALTEPCLRNLILAPMLGGLFLMFLPLIGYVLFIKWVATKLAEKAQALIQPPAAVGAAYLTGHPNDANVSGSRVERKEDALDALAKEIEEKKLDS